MRLVQVRFGGTAQIAANLAAVSTMSSHQQPSRLRRCDQLHPTSTNQDPFMHIKPLSPIDAALLAGESVLAIAHRLDVPTHQVSARRQALGLAQPRRKAADVLVRAHAELELADATSAITGALKEKLAASLANDGRLPAGELSADALALLAARDGLVTTRAAVEQTLGPIRTERLFGILAAEDLMLVGLSGTGIVTRAHVVCSDCAGEGGCGHAPTVRSLEASAERSPRCMRKARVLRSAANMPDGAAQLARIEAGGYWQLAPGATYEGAHGLVRLICPEGCTDSYVYKKALAGARCRHCADGKLSQRILMEVLRTMFGGEWFWEDRSRGYELDCWCPAPARGATYAIAAAHDGPTHFGQDIYGVGPERMRRVAEIDAARAADLAADGIPFVRVRFDDLVDDLAPSRQRFVFERIEQAVEATGLVVPAYRRFDLRTVERRRIEEARTHAARLGVELRTSKWPGRRGTITWFCPRHRVDQEAQAGNFLARRGCCKHAAEPDAEAQLALFD